MRIIKISIENINSLRGKWTIDFSDESYAENGNQFVISGATGAGKTTILDAICLALYGKTPREQNINKSGNELMCKSEGSCSVELVYECPKGRFRSTFSQHRANYKPDKPLQDAICSLIEEETGEYIAEDVKASKIESYTKGVIGLDYAQFCKSIILAQGSFNEFIKGNERTKADILAKLNGTQHYKKVGELLWKKAKEAKDNYDNIIKEIGSMPVLSDEEREKIEAEDKAIDKELEKIALELGECAKKIYWREEYENKEKALKEAENEKDKFEQRKQDFAKDEKRLELANKAYGCENKYEAYITIANEYGLKENNYAKTKEELDAANHNVERARRSKEEKASSYNELESKQKTYRDCWKEVRSLDGNIANQEAAYGIQEKVATEAKENYDSNREKLETANREIEETKNKISQLEDYLNANENNKQLEQKLPYLKAKQDMIINQIHAVSDWENRIVNLNRELAERTNELDRVNTEIERIEGELKDYVSDNYKSISLFIRQYSLQEDKPCPVCGSTEHPFVNNAGAAPAIQEEMHNLGTDLQGEADASTLEGVKESNNSAVARVIELSDLNEKKIKEKEGYILEVRGTKNALEEKERGILEYKKKLRELLAEMNEALSLWNKKIDEADILNSIARIIRELEILQEEWNSKTTEKDSLNKNISIMLASIEHIKLQELEDKYKKEDEELNKIKEALDGIKEQRVKLFGQKNVDDAQEEYEKELTARKKALDEANKGFNEAEKALEKAKADYCNAQNELEEKRTSWKTSEEAFKKAVLENGFSNEQEFLDARMEDAKRNELETAKEKLKQEAIEIKANYEKAVKDFEAHKKEGRTSETKDYLLREQKMLEDKKGENNQKKGSIRKDLENDSEIRAKLREKNKELEEKSKEYDIYEKIKAMIGKKSDDLEVFVQKLVMDNLLIHANEHLQLILPDYKLIQKEDSLDCILHDINYNDEKYDRPISNLSGGETFAVSLSFALAIAETACERVSMDSLFLDEGFGTLSGEPLTQAINALKKLKTTGKMIGIITHIEPVIAEFDQKISAKKVRGYSVLEGPGISKG